MIPALVFTLFAQAVAPAREAAAARFTQALTSTEIRTLLPLATKQELSGDGWASVREFFERWDCVSIRSVRSHDEGEWLVVDVDGDGITRNAKHERRPISAIWYLKFGANGIAEAKSEADHFAALLVAAKDDDARRAIIERHAEIAPAIARQIMALARRTDRARAKEPALFLLDWSERNGDASAETFALLALARLAFYGNDSDTGSHLALAANDAALRADDCDAIAWANAVAGYFVADDKLRMQYRNAAIDAFDSLDDPSPAYYALNAQVSDAYTYSNYAAGFRADLELLDIARRYGSREQEMTALQNEALFREELGDWDGSLEIASQNATLAREQLNAEYEARSCNIIGECYAERAAPDYQKAVVYLQKAVETLPPSLMRGPVFQLNLGDALVRAGRAAEAEKYLAPALTGTRIMTYTAKAYLFGEHLRRAQGRYAEAMQFARDGVTASTGDLYFTWELKADLGNMLIECGDAENGIEELREAIDLIESRRALNSSDAMARTHHFATRLWVYGSLVDVLAKQKRFEEAFSVAERMKARALDDSFAGQSDRLELTVAEAAEQRALNQRIVDLNKQIIAAKRGAEANARRDLREARVELETFNASMGIRHAKSTGAQTTADPLDVAADLHRTVVEYAVLPDSIVAFVVRNGRVSGTVLKAHPDKIARDAARFMASIRKRDLDYAPKARALYDELIRPIASSLDATVTIVPDSFLWNVPFDALMTPSHKFLIEEHALAYAPSVMMLDTASRHRKAAGAAHELLAFGDPTIATATRSKAAVYRDLSLAALPDAAREARALATVYGANNSTVFTHATAREATLKHLASGYRIIHLATHGIVDDQSPLYSALVMARSDSDREDGLLEMREVRDLDLHADLIVLSACDTARGTVYPGEGVIGLSWAFLTAGCPTTVVSQWNVESRSTSTLMIDFHRRLRAGDDTAAALRTAMLALMHDHSHSHPLYWAPFIIVGDGIAKIR